MADHEVSVGSDLDGDDLNNKLETDNGTDPESEDTDGDGIMDGVEILRGLTNPLIVDSDGDGLPDGTEDYDADGRVDLGETDPNNMDSDGDGLCDGYCPFGFSNRLVCAFDETGDCVDFSTQFSMFKEDPEDPESISIIETRWYAGEDKNANRVVDSGETDPTKIATFTDSETGDPILDLEIFFQCALSGGGEIIDC